MRTQVSQRTVGLGLTQVGWRSGGFLEVVSPEGRMEGRVGHGKRHQGP